MTPQDRALIDGMQLAELDTADSDVIGAPLHELIIRAVLRRCRAAGLPVVGRRGAAPAGKRL